MIAEIDMQAVADWVIFYSVYGMSAGFTMYFTGHYLGAAMRWIEEFVK